MEPVTQELVRFLDTFEDSFFEELRSTSEHSDSTAEGDGMIQSFQQMKGASIEQEGEGILCNPSNVLWISVCILLRLSPDPALYPAMSPEEHSPRASPKRFSVNESCACTFAPRLGLHSHIFLLP